MSKSEKSELMATIRWLRGYVDYLLRLGRYWKKQAQEAKKK